MSGYRREPANVSNFCHFIARIPDVVESGDRRQNDRAPEKHAEEPGIGIRPTAQNGDRQDPALGGESQPDQAGDAERQLEGGFPFSQPVGGKNLPGLHGDLAQAGDEKLAPDDQRGDPERTIPLDGKKHEPGADEDFVGQRVEQLAERGHQAHPAGQIPVEPVAGRREHEHDQRQHVAARAVRRGGDHEHHGHDEPRKGNGIRQVHGRASCPIPGPNATARLPDKPQTSAGTSQFPSTTLFEKCGSWKVHWRQPKERRRLAGTAGPFRAIARLRRDVWEKNGTGGTPALLESSSFHEHALFEQGRARAPCGNAGKSTGSAFPA